MRHQQLLDDYCNYVGLNRTPSTVYVNDSATDTGGKPPGKRTRKS